MPSRFDARRAALIAIAGAVGACAATSEPGVKMSEVPGAEPLPTSMSPTPSTSSAVASASASASASEAIAGASAASVARAPSASSSTDVGSASPFSSSDLAMRALNEGSASAALISRPTEGEWAPHPQGIPASMNTCFYTRTSCPTMGSKKLTQWSQSHRRVISQGPTPRRVGGDMVCCYHALYSRAVAVPGRPLAVRGVARVAALVRTSLSPVSPTSTTSTTSSPWG